MLQIQLSSIKKMEEYARNDNSIISLSQGGLKLGVPDPIKEHLQEILKTNSSDYYGSASGLAPLRGKIAQVASQKNNTFIDWKQVIITHGASGGISTLVLALLEKGDEVILPEPTYPSYEKILQIARAEIKYVPCKESFEINLQAIKKAKTKKTRMLIFSNPANPTGAITPKETIAKLVEWCDKEGIYLLVDEVYQHYVFEGKLHSAANYVNQTDRVVAINSFSKNFAMSGWRVGYLIVPKKIVELINATQDALIVCPSTISQYGALYALEHPELVESFRKVIKLNRDSTIQSFKELVDRKVLSFQPPNAGFYLFIDTKTAQADGLCLDIVKKAKVTLVPGSAFGRSYPSHVRLCYARDPHLLKEALARLVDYWKKHNV